MKSAFLVAALAVVASGACNLLSNAECSVDSDCHGSHVCVAGQCVECRTDRDCDVNETCSAGSCERGGGEGEGEGAHGGEGEGEGAHGGEGEGEGAHGGEGEGGAGEGEGEGEGSTSTAALSFSLTWDNTDADLDIHATKGTPYCLDDTSATAATTPPTYGPLSQACTGAPLDCHYSNCKSSPGFPAAVDWDGSGAGGTPGDPVLEFDWINSTTCPPGETTCSPRELIDVQARVAGTYLVEAVYYGNEFAATNPPPVTAANATLTVSFRGSTLKTVTTALAAAGATHDLVVVHVAANGDVTCVGDVTDGTDECGP